MKHNLISINEVAQKLGVSLQTLRRWDASGKLKSIRSKPRGHRYYRMEDTERIAGERTKNLFHEALSWVSASSATEPPSHFYCSNSSIFQARLTNLEAQLSKIPLLRGCHNLIAAIAGEIGNNSFDHNLGNWPDIPGVFFGYDINKKHIVLADRGQGILTTLKRVKSELTTHTEALQVAFTEITSARAPESRGNGLKFIRQIISENDMSLRFLSGDAELHLRKRSDALSIRQNRESIHGCLAFIKF